MTLDSFQKRADAMKGFCDRMAYDLEDLRKKRSDCIHAAKVQKSRFEFGDMQYWLRQARFYQSLIMSKLKCRRSVQKRADLLQTAADLERLNTSRQAAE